MLHYWYLGVKIIEAPAIVTLHTFLLPLLSPPLPFLPLSPLPPPLALFLDTSSRQPIVCVCVFTQTDETRDAGRKWKIQNGEEKNTDRGGGEGERERHGGRLWWRVKGEGLFSLPLGHWNEDWCLLLWLWMTEDYKEQQEKPIRKVLHYSECKRWLTSGVNQAVTIKNWESASKENIFAHFKSNYQYLSPPSSFQYLCN